MDDLKNYFFWLGKESDLFVEDIPFRMKGNSIIFDDVVHVGPHDCLSYKTIYTGNKMNVERVTLRRARPWDERGWHPDNEGHS